MVFAGELRVVKIVLAALGLAIGRIAAKEADIATG
jgi:hypothetical protein